MTPSTEILLVETEQNTAAQITETPTTSYEITEALTAIACLTFFPLLYLVGNWFFN